VVASAPASAARPRDSAGRQRSEGAVGRLPLAHVRAATVFSVLLAVLASGCMSVSTNTAVLSDASHLGTPYSGTRGDLHTLVCFARDVSRDASGLLLAPVMLVPLVDLPLSFALDTLLLPVDLALEPDRPPQGIGKGGCRLVGM
jgi:uncharacterized protein YceK